MSTPNKRLQFGKYRVIGEIGRGGMGVVYKARDTRLDRIVALKVLHPAFALDAAFTKRFRAEAKAIAALNHPGIVSIHTLEEASDMLVLEMEYLSGGSMLERLYWPAMSIDQTMLASAEILNALAACHSAGIVHRDIKPSNILFADDDRAVISDFGLAKALSTAWTGDSGHSASGTIAIGTPIYMPPEAWDDEQPDPSWDLYATGIVMYQAITQTSPLNAVTARGVVKELETQSAPQLQESNPRISPALNDLVYALSARDSAQRIGNAQEALDALQLTTEYQRAIANHPTPRRRAMAVRSRKLPLRIRMIRAWASQRVRTTAAVMSVAVLVLLAALSARLTVPATEATIANASIAPQSPAPAPAIEPIGEAELAATNRGTFGAIYDTVVAESGATYSNHIGIRLLDNEPTGVMLAKTSKKIWYLHLTRGPENTLAMEGHWAHYEGDENTFRHGTVTGQGQFRTKRVLLATLHFTDAESGERFSRTFTANRTESPVSDTAFLLTAERVNELQPLLYNELLPRQLSWAVDLERMFPAIPNMRTTVPLVPSVVGPPILDGQLGDAFWKYPAGADKNHLGLLLGSPGALAPELHARFTEDALYLSLRAFEDLNPSKTGVDIALMHRVSVPTWQAERWLYCHRGDATPYAVHRVKATDVPWDPDWTVVCGNDRGAWQAEVRIPYASIGRPGPPDIHERWRLNVAIHDLSQAEPVQCFQWGFPIPLRVEHGAILHLTEAQPS